MGAACVCYLREKMNLSDPYREEIMQISNLSQTDILSCSLSFLAKFDSVFNSSHSFLSKSPLKDNNSSSSYKPVSSLASPSFNYFLQENKKPLHCNNFSFRDKLFDSFGDHYKNMKNTENRFNHVKNLSVIQRNTFLDYPKSEYKLTKGNSTHNVNTITTNYSALASTLPSSFTNQNELSHNNSHNRLISFASSSSSSSSLSAFQRPPSVQSCFQKSYKLPLNSYAFKKQTVCANAGIVMGNKMSFQMPTSLEDGCQSRSNFAKTNYQMNSRTNTSSFHSFLGNHKF